jgi:hypothetical protein
MVIIPSGLTGRTISRSIRSKGNSACVSAINVLNNSFLGIVLWFYLEKQETFPKSFRIFRKCAAKVQKINE